MRFQFQEKTWKLWFKYDANKKRRETLCFIEIDGSGHTFAVGSTECSAEDRFEKVTGREIALHRCLKKCMAMGMTNEFWKLAMNSYKNRAKIKLAKKGAVSGNWQRASQVHI